MRIDWWTLGLQTVNVLVLIWILARFLFRPVAAIVDARRAEAARVLDEARAAKAEAVAERGRAAEEATRLADARGETLRAAASEAKAETSALLAAARANADELRAAAEAEIARMRESAAIAAADSASRLAVDIAAKLFARLPEEARIAGFVDGLATGVAALPGEARARIGADGGPVLLRTARPLSGVEAESCRAALGRVLGRPVEFVVEVDPGLIAGLEIETPHAVVRNDFRADLTRIAGELTRHDHAVE